MPTTKKETKTKEEDKTTEKKASPVKGEEKKKEKKAKTTEKLAKSKKTTANKNVSAKVKEKSPIDREKQYSIEETIDLIKKTAKTKFDSSVEAHFRLGIDTKKGDQQVRGAVSLPHGSGKKIVIAAFVTPDNQAEAKIAGADFVGGEDLIEEIKKTEKTDFQIAVAEPAIMPKLAKIAKILGTRGLMPSPKNETVTPTPAKAIEELKKGKISFKNDDTGNIHVTFGKVSFEASQLIENFNVILEAIRKAKPTSTKGIFIKNISACSTMGKGVKITN